MPVGYLLDEVDLVEISSSEGDVPKAIRMDRSNGSRSLGTRTGQKRHPLGDIDILATSAKRDEYPKAVQIDISKQQQGHCNGSNWWKGTSSTGQLRCLMSHRKRI